VFVADEGAPARRRRRYSFASVLLVAALLGGGVAARVSHDGRKPFVDALNKVPYVKTLVQRARY
jgi:hypothetical protein